MTLKLAGAPVGLLDYCTLDDAKQPGARLQGAVDLAVLAEELGYSRYWLAEHHGGTAAHACPEVVAAAVLARTRRISVGPAGILLNFYSPLKVASTFVALEALFPGRVDLGLGRGVSSPAMNAALLDGRPPPSLEDHGRKVETVVGYLRGMSPSSGPASGSRTTPAGSAPRVWALGHSRAGASHAGALGTSFAMALFFGRPPPEGPLAFAEYRKAFVRPTEDARPLTCAAVGVYCSDDEKDVADLLRTHANPYLVPNVVGSPAQCRAYLEEVLNTYGPDELVLGVFGRSHAARERSIRLLAELMD